MQAKVDIVLHSRTRQGLEALSQGSSHATLLHGEVGVGLRAAARWLASCMQTTHVTEIAPDEKGTISIDVIRDLYQQTRAKQQPLVIIIDDADAMQQAAQNALLKLLEEPNSAISFILTTHKLYSLLQTIRSRTQLQKILPLDDVATHEFLDTYNIADPARRTQLIFMAKGRPAELTRLVQDADYFAQHVQYVTDAKQYLQGSQYEKLLVIQKYGNDRAAVLKLLAAASNILSFSLQKNPQPLLVEQLDKMLLTQEKIYENRHVKTQLLASSY